ncbi:hypothetical protein P3S68_015278 [Capsicum galapagoense]
MCLLIYRCWLCHLKLQTKSNESNVMEVLTIFLKVSPLSSLTLVDKHILHGVTFQQVYRLQNPDAYGYVPRNAI